MSREFFTGKLETKTLFSINVNETAQEVKIIFNSPSDATRFAEYLSELQKPKIIIFRKQGEAVIIHYLRTITSEDIIGYLRQYLSHDEQLGGEKSHL